MDMAVLNVAMLTQDARSSRARTNVTAVRYVAVVESVAVHHLATERLLITLLNATGVARMAILFQQVVLAVLLRLPVQQRNPPHRGSVLSMDMEL